MTMTAARNVAAFCSKVLTLRSEDLLPSRPLFGTNMSMTEDLRLAEFDLQLLLLRPAICQAGGARLTKASDKAAMPLLPRGRFFCRSAKGIRFVTSCNTGLDEPASNPPEAIGWVGNRPAPCDDALDSFGLTRTKCVVAASQATRGRLSALHRDQPTSFRIVINSCKAFGRNPSALPVLFLLGGTQL